MNSRTSSGTTTPRSRGGSQPLSVYSEWVDLLRGPCNAGCQAHNLPLSCGVRDIAHDMTTARTPVAVVARLAVFTVCRRHYLGYPRLLDMGIHQNPYVVDDTRLTLEP